MTEPEFRPFPKIARLRRPIIVTEKIDGTNGAIRIEPVDVDSDASAGDPLWQDPNLLRVVMDEEGEQAALYAQSRRRLIAPGKSTDNHGFAAWVRHYAAPLAAILGPGLHFGEWYGRGIQRGYGIEKEEGHNGKFFALFNVGRWQDKNHNDLVTFGAVPGLTTVPWLAEASTLGAGAVDTALRLLDRSGSYATGTGPRHEPAEGVVVYHAHSNTLFKQTFENDEAGKGEQ